MNLLGKEKIPFIFIIDFDKNSPLVFPLNEVPDDILFDFEGMNNIKDLIDINKKSYKIIKYPVDIEAYKVVFDKVMKNLLYGNSYLTNLTFSNKIEINLTLKEIFEVSNAKYKLLIEDKLVCFSPETFVKISENRIYSFPMKGTIDASVADAEMKILNDFKETAEHNTIVDLIRNDLSIVSKNVQVDRFRYIEKIKSDEKELLQVSSQISGDLPNNWSEKVGDMIFNLLPAGSISGAPKESTIGIINETETYKRNYYTGICGIFDGKNINSGVMIRFIENINGELFYKSGGGITVFSNLQSEYNEMIDKIYVPLA